MELLASVLGKEYDVTIAERIQFMYQTHLQVNINRHTSFATISDSNRIETPFILVSVPLG